MSSRLWVIEADRDRRSRRQRGARRPPVARHRELGLSEFRLVINLVMTENQTFYPRHGYTETGRRRQDGYDRVFYAKRLAAH
jgi:hypothetical protein